MPEINTRSIYVPSTSAATDKILEELKSKWSNLCDRHAEEVAPEIAQLDTLYLRTQDRASRRQILDRREDLHYNTRGALRREELLLYAEAYRKLADSFQAEAENNSK
jgi:hypothetical protein